MRLSVENLTFSYGKKRAIENITLSVDKGEFVGLIGPNGSGKSTVLKNVYRALTPDSGKIVLDGENLLKMPYKKSAIKMAVVGQENELPFDFSVEEIVAMGRTPHKKIFDIDNANDRAIVHHALEHLGMENMAKRSYMSLSGGEKQRVIIARAIAQESDFLILDEPTNHLDISYQMQIFDFIKRLNVTVLSAIHDLNMAALYCDRIYAFKDGKIVLQGTPEEVLTSENIFDIFGVRSSVTKNSITGKTSITYLPAQIKGE
ncbi:MAG: ABC transporter ATP-binding protein [Eubacterium sp.]|nr:ABC transporter ATP-binding protein [Eubacterium sp.]